MMMTTQPTISTAAPLSSTAAKAPSPTVGEVCGYDHTALAVGQKTAVTVGSINAGGVSGQRSYSPSCSDPSTKCSSSWGCETCLNQKHASGASGGLLGAADFSLSYGFASDLKTTGPHTLRNSTDSFPAVVDNAIDGAVIRLLLPQGVTNGIGGKCVGNSTRGRLESFSEFVDLSAHIPACEGPEAGLGMAACAAAARDDLSATVKQMLAGLPSEQHRLFTQALAASSSPQQLLSAMQAGRADATASFAHPASTAQLANNACGSTCASPSSSQPALLGRGAADWVDPNAQSRQLLQLQAALIAQQQALAPSRSTWAASPTLSPAGHNLMQLLAAEEQASAHQPWSTKSLAALAQYATSEGLSPEGGRLPQYCLALSNSAAPAPTDPWSSNSLSAPAAGHETVATAAAMLQHQQQQAHLELLIQSAMSSPAAAATFHDPLTTQYLSAQLAAAAAAAAAATYSAVLGPMCRAPAATAARLSTHGVALDSFNQPTYISRGAVPAPRPGTGRTSPPGSCGRRGRSGGPRSTSDSVLQHSSDGSSHSLGPRKPGALDSASAAAAAGVCISALSPATFTEHWATDMTPSDTAASQDGFSLLVSPSTSSCSGSEIALSDCSRRSSIASAGSPLASGRLTSADGEVFLMDLGVHSRDRASSDKVSSLFAADMGTANASKCASMELTPTILDKASSVSSLSHSKAAVLDPQEQEQASGSTQATPAADIQPTISCPVWYPTARESSGDDSWHLKLPPTCRLFVGNIGCWVDEALLLSYFGKYGTVVDVQVMWNTKMLARGRRVNREFAFISYSTPLEAARAVHWLDGCRLADIEKDKNGVTVEYENGESVASPASTRSSTAAATKPAKG